MIKKNQTVGAIVILLGSLAMIAIMFTNFRGGNATRIFIDGVPLWQKDAPDLPIPPGVQRFQERIEAHAIEGQIAISSGAGESSVSQALRDAKVSVKRTLRNASRAPLAQEMRTKPLSHLLTGVAIAALLCVGYVFLDAGTRGHFTWRLRIAAVVAFAAILVATASLRGQL